MQPLDYNIKTAIFPMLTNSCSVKYQCLVMEQFGVGGLLCRVTQSAVFIVETFDCEGHQGREIHDSYVSGWLPNLMWTACLFSPPLCLNSFSITKNAKEIKSVIVLIYIPPLLAG